MHPMDSKIKPDVGVREGRVVIHPHSNEPYVFCNGKWNLVRSDVEDPQQAVQDEAYERAMGGL